MKKAVLFFFALVVLTGFAVSESEAGQICWQMTPFSDIIKVTITSPDPLRPANKLLVGTRYVSSVYYTPVTGTMVKDQDGVQKRVSLHGTFPSGGTTLYYVSIDATIDPVTKNGPFLYLSSSGATVTGTLSKIPCSTAPLPSGSSIIEGISIEQ